MSISQELGIGPPGVFSDLWYTVLLLLLSRVHLTIKSVKSHPYTSSVAEVVFASRSIKQPQDQLTIVGTYHNIEVIDVNQTRQNKAIKNMNQFPKFLSPAVKTTHFLFLLELLKELSGTGLVSFTRFMFISS